MASPGSPDLSKSTLKTEEESCDDTSYKPLQFFIAQSMPIPETTVLPSGVEVSSYCRSVLKGDIQLIEKARSEKKDINVTSNNTPRCLLHYGVLAEVPEEKRYRNLKKLVDLGADREQRDEHGRTPLHLAVLLGDTKAVDVLLEAGCDITAKCHGNNLMHLATVSGDPDMFHKVRGVGFEPREVTEYGFTSVHLAACYNQHQMIPLLKRYGVDVNQYSTPGNFDIQQMIICSILPIGFDFFKLYVLQNLRCGISRRYIGCQIDFLHKSNAEAQQFVHNVSNCTNVIRTHPLLLATVFGFIPVVKALVDNGADTNCVSPSGKTPLFLAACNGQLELVQYYVQKLHALGNSLARSALCKLIFLPTAVGAVDVVEFLVRSLGNLTIMSMPESRLELSLADLAALTNQPEILQLAFKMERERYIAKSSLTQNQSTSYLLYWSIVGGWFFQVASNKVPQLTSVLEVTEERQLAVMSTILDSPGCDPLLNVPSTRCSHVDIAILLSQPYALDIILSYLTECNVTLPSDSTILIPDHIQSLPLPHLCVRSVEVIRTLSAELPVNALQNAAVTFLLAGYLVICQNVVSTFDVLLKHGYSVNCLDSRGLTCLDYALAIKNVELQQFLYSRGAVLARDLDEKKRLKDENEKLAHENEYLKSQIDALRKLSESFQSLVLSITDQPRASVPVSTPLPSVPVNTPSPSVPITTPSPSVPITTPGPSVPITTPSPSVPVTTPGPSVPITTPSPSVPVSTQSPSVLINVIPPSLSVTTPTDPLLTAPTLNQLNRLIIRQIALDWYSVGLHLEIDVPTLQIIEADVYPPSVEKCCRTMFTKWLSHDEGTGGAPRRWRTVLKALKDVGYNSLVGDVERVLFEQNQ